MASPSTIPERLAGGRGSTPDKQQRACANCARSKIKCVWPTPDCCERCSKNGLQCTVPEIGPRKKRGKSTRVKTLESKVEHILSILSTNQQSPAAPNGVLEEAARILGHATPTSSTSSELPLHQGPPTTATLDPDVEIVPGFRVSFSEADQLLRARRMLRETPILLKAVITACRPQVSPIRDDIDHWFRTYFAQHVLVNDEKTLEHLQAILIFIAWNDWHFTLHARETILLQMAQGIAGDLGLTRAPEDQVVPAKSIADEAPIQVPGFNIRKEPTNAGRRALLGVFYMTSTLWTMFRRSEPLAHTEYMEQCCRELCKANEYPTDHLVAGLVRVQRLLLRVIGLFPRRAVDPTPNLGMSHVLAFASTQRELDAVMQGLPDTVRHNYVLCSHYHTVLMRMYEPTIYAKPSDGGQASDVRGEALRTCCESAKALLELHLAIPAEVSVTSTITYVSGFGFGNLTLTRLLFLEDRDWDAAAARRAVDYPHLMQRFIEHFQAADRRWRWERPGNARYAERMRWARNWYLAKTSDSCNELPSAVDDVLGEAHYIEDNAWQMMFDGGYGTEFL